MVSIAPNQFQIEGKIVSKENDAVLEGFARVTVHLQKVEHLEGPEEFLPLSTNEVVIHVQHMLAADWKEGQHLICNIRKAPGHFFVLPTSIKLKREKRQNKK